MGPVQLHSFLCAVNQGIASFFFPFFLIYDLFLKFMLIDMLLKIF